MPTVSETYKLLLSIIRQKMDDGGIIIGVDWQKVADDLGLQTADGARGRWRKVRRVNGISEPGARPSNVKKRGMKKKAKPEEDAQIEQGAKQRREEEEEDGEVLDENKADRTSSASRKGERQKDVDMDVEYWAYEYNDHEV